MNRRVSIVTPCFEHERFLEDYFESLLAQTYPDIELVFCDDGSSDRSWEIASGYRARLEEKLNRVVLLENEQNLGLIATLERLRSEATGSVFSILESDDYLHPTKVEENVSYLDRHPEVGLVHSDADFLYMRDGRLQSAHWASKGGPVPVGEAFESLLHENCVLTCTVACRSSLVEEHVDFPRYARRGYRAADYPMFLDLARHTKFGYLNRPLAVYRIVDGSISHPQSDVKRYQWRFDYCRVKQDYIQEYGCSAEIRRRADSQLHKSQMALGWSSGSAELFDQGVSWLLEHRPRAVGRWTRGPRRVAIRNRALWRATRQLEKLVARTRSGGKVGDRAAGQLPHRL